MSKASEKGQNGKVRKASGGAVLYRNFNFLTFLAILAMVYIANGHRSEAKIRKIHALKDDVKELRSEYIFLESEIMYNSTPSQMASGVEGMELSVRDGLPRRLKAEAEEH